MLTLALSLATAQLTVQEEGVTLGSAWIINCSGSGITCTREAATRKVTMSVSSSGGGDGGGIPDTIPVITYSASSDLSSERVLSAGNYTTVDLGTAAQAQVDWAHGLTCSAGQALTTSGTTAMACTSTLTASDLACAGTCVADAEIAAVSGSKVSGAVATAYSADAGFYAHQFITNPTDCAGGFALAIDSSGNLTCSSAYIAIEDEGNPLTERDTLNFAGAGISCVDDTTRTTCTVAGTPTLYNQTIQDEGGALTQRATLNFTGAGVSCVDNAGSSRTDCTIAGGGGSRTVYASNGSDTPISVAPTDPGTALISKTLTVAANDTVTIEVFADIMNNSGGTRTYTLRCRAGSTTLVAVSDSTTLAAGTTRGTYYFRCVYAVRSTGSTRVRGDLQRTPTTAANTTQTGADRAAWNTSASDWTGSQTFALNISSSAIGATQDAIVTSYEITHQASSP